MKFKTIIFISFALVLFFNRLTYAKEIDFQSNNYFDSNPFSSFAIKLNDKIVGYANDTFYDSSLYNFDLEPEKINLNLNDVIQIEDLSTPSLNQKIKNWDLQIYPPNEDERIYLCSSKNEVNKKIVLDKEGIWNIYLCVIDDSPLINGMQNFSINGNHRWLGKSKEIDDLYYWWYFSQIRIVVSNDEDETVDDNEKEDEKTYEEKEKEDEENSNPETEIYVPKVIYPNEITSKSNYKNIITWDYYDKDDDSMIDSGYKLYKYEGNEKVLIKEEKELLKSQSRRIEIIGEEKEKFELSVWVEDSNELYGYDTKIIVISSFYPDITISTVEKTYLDEYIDVSINEDNYEFNKYLNFDYEKWKVTNEKSQIVVEGIGKVPDKLWVSKEEFEEKNYYTIIQILDYKNVKKEFKTHVFTVDVLPPNVELENLSGYYGQKVKINSSIVQPQSRFKGDLYDYICDFTNCKSYYQILNNEGDILYVSNGIVDGLTLNETYGFSKEENNKTYQIVQYVSNTKGKVGVGKALIEVKIPSNSEIFFKIIDKDGDTSTPSNEIYPGESLIFETTIVNGFYEIVNMHYELIDKKNNALLVKEDGILNGEKKFELDVGKYTFVQYGKDVTGKIYSKSIDVNVKEILKPVITNTLECKDMFEYNDSIKTNYIVYDVNKSDEHPNGFKLITNYIINDTKYEGIYKEKNANEFEKGKTNLIIQYAFNSEHLNVYNYDEIKFQVVNSIPTIEVDMPKISFVNDKFKIKIRLNDIDGMIQDYNYYFKNNYLTIINENIINNLSNITIELDVIAKEKGIEELIINCIDDSNANNARTENIQIIYSIVPIDLEIVNEENIEMKIDRYVEWIASSSNSDNIELSYINDFNKENIINFNNNFYEDEFVKIYCDKYEKQYINFSMYFKKTGIYTFKARAIKENQIGMWKEKQVNVLDDSVPKLIIELPKEVIRSMPSKTFFISGTIIKENNDNENEVQITIWNDYEKNKIIINDDKFNYETLKNDLGKFYVQGYLKKRIYQLPNENHPLYIEIKSKEKETFSDIKVVNTVNQKPTLTYDLNNTNYKITQYEER